MLFTIPDKIEPGMITSMIDDIVKHGKDVAKRNFNLSVDLKKINANKQDVIGGVHVDVSGFEKSPLKEEQERILTVELQIIKDTRDIFEDVEMASNQSYKNLSPIVVVDVVNNLKKLITVQGTRIEGHADNVIWKLIWLKEVT